MVLDCLPATKTFWLSKNWHRRVKPDLFSTCIRTTPNSHIWQNQPWKRMSRTPCIVIQFEWQSHNPATKWTTNRFIQNAEWHDNYSDNIKPIVCIHTSRTCCIICGTFFVCYLWLWSYKWTIRKIYTNEIQIALKWI